MDRFGIDSHKMQYFPQRIAEWQKTGTAYPIYVEISPAGSCNHRCSFCAVDYIGYVQKYIDIEKMKDCLSSMARVGVRSVMYAGEGEPLLHPKLAEIINYTENVGIDVGITTNAVPLTEKFCDAALGATTWIKASINAGRADTYAKVQGTKMVDWDRAWRNMLEAVLIKKERRLGVNLGAQMVLLPENQNEALDFCVKAFETGLDYAVVKPYSQHPMSKGTEEKYGNLKYGSFAELEAEMKKLNTPSFNAVFRGNAISNLAEEGRGYEKCRSTPHFWAYIMASGDVYGCSAYLLDERFKYGNINENTFKEVWDGDKRKACIDYVNNKLDISECRKNCRMDKVNRYLWDLENPPAHVNFI